MRIFSKLTNPILSEIVHYFGFLLDRGYQIQKTDISFWANRNWEIILESPECVIKIFSDQFTVFLVFAPINEDIDNRLEISGLIYYLSKGNKFIGKLESDYHRNRKEQLEKLANLLEEYIDQIAPYFSVKEFQEYKSELLTASQEYGRLYMRKYVPGF